jgi:alkanesulfonate monooxygenase SsuD/methylene tetrahydromethanopterin reductase-like flavin-dependent oxidoreductase (luciferase family)
MKFAHFSHIWGKPGMTPHQRYEQLWRELQLCDGLGFDYSFCVEHHFRPDESWISSPSLYAIGAGARTKRMRVGPMGYIVPLYHPLRLVEEIAIVDQMLGGRMELGLVPGISPDYFKPFGFDYNFRKSPTLEFVDYLRAAYGDKQPFSFHGEVHHTDSAEISVQPMQKPHPPLWMMSRDPQTLEFCAKNAINPGYFKHDLVFIGSPETVSRKIYAAAAAGVFNVFMGEFNFSDLPERDLLRSIRLFGEKVIPALREYEPF